MKKNLIIAAFAATALIACKDDKKEMDDVDDMSMETEMEMDDNMKMEESTTAKVSYTKDDAEKMQLDFEESVMVENDRATTIQGWTVYNTVNNDIVALRAASADTRMTASQKLRADFNQLKNSIPAYMNVRRVRRAVEDVDNEITDFEEDAADASTSERKMEKNLENISEAYDDLAEAIAKAREQYIENKADAMEEYLEEVNDIDSGQTTDERYRDAREEYNEEMDQK